MDFGVMHLILEIAVMIMTYTVETLTFAMASVSVRGPSLQLRPT